MPLDGGDQASVSDSGLGIGPHAVAADYLGDTAFSGSSGTLSGGQTVTGQIATTTAVSTSLNPSRRAIGDLHRHGDARLGDVRQRRHGAVRRRREPLSWTADAQRQQSGHVSDSALTVGTHTITAAYSGDTRLRRQQRHASGGRMCRSATTTTVACRRTRRCSGSGDLHGHGDARLGHVRQRRHGAVRRGRDQLRLAGEA